MTFLKLYWANELLPLILVGQDTGLFQAHQEEILLERRWELLELHAYLHDGLLSGWPCRVASRIGELHTTIHKSHVAFQVHILALIRTALLLQPRE